MGEANARNERKLIGRINFSGICKKVLIFTFFKNKPMWIYTKILIVHDTRVKYGWRIDKYIQ